MEGGRVGGKFPGLEVKRVNIEIRLDYLENRSRLTILIVNTIVGGRAVGVRKCNKLSVSLLLLSLSLLTFHRSPLQPTANDYEDDIT